MFKFIFRSSIFVFSRYFTYIKHRIHKLFVFNLATYLLICFSPSQYHLLKLQHM